MMRKRLTKPLHEIKNRDGKVVASGDKALRFLLEDLALKGPLVNLDLHSEDLRGLHLQTGSIFKDCYLGGTGFAGAQLIGAQFIDCDLVQAFFKKATVYGALFDRCEMYEVHFDGANLRKTVIRNSDLNHASFDGALFQQTRFLDVSVSEDLTRPGLELRA